MIRYYLLVLFILKVSSSAQALSGDLNVFWWNIGFNQYSTKISPNDPRTSLDVTLSNNNWEKYDLIVLGEYVSGKVQDSSLEKINKLFPYSKIIKYNNAYDRSIYIRSKTNFTFIEEELDWVDPSWAQWEINQSRKDSEFFYGSTATFKRKYIRIKLVKNGITYFVVPYHFNNPWVGLKKKIGKWFTASEIVWGDDNPLYNQIINLHHKIKNDLGNYYDQKKLII